MSELWRGFGVYLESYREGLLGGIRSLWSSTRLLWAKEAPTDKAIEVVKKPKQGKDFVEGNYKSFRQLLNDVSYWSDIMAKFRTSHLDADRLVKTLGVYIPGEIEWYQVEGVPTDTFPLYFATTFNSATLGKELKKSDQVTMLVYGTRCKYNNCCDFISKPKNGWFYDVYLCYYLDGKWHRTNTFAEVVDKKFKLLPFNQCEQQRLPGGVSYSHKVWRKRPLMVSEKHYSAENTEQYITMAFNAYMRRGASTEIHATKGGARLIFSVPEHQWKDFFKDRITAKTTDGKRKRIFHHVASHKRANGSIVPMHTRGETEFTWAGHNIRIVEQKRGRLYMTECEANSEASDDLALPKGGYWSSQAASVILRQQLKRIHQQTRDVA